MTLLGRTPASTAVSGFKDHDLLYSMPLMSFDALRLSFNFLFLVFPFTWLLFYIVDTLAYIWGAHILDHPILI